MHDLSTRFTGRPAIFLDSPRLASWNIANDAIEGVKRGEVRSILTGWVRSGGFVSTMLGAGLTAGVLGLGFAV